MTDLTIARMAMHGPGALADEDLLAAISGANRRSRPRIARAFAQLGSLAALARMVDGEMLLNSGLARREARRVLAAVELARRLYAPEPGAVIHGPADVVAQVRDLIGASEVECLALVCLNRRHRVISREVVSVGSAGATMVDPPTIFRTALRHCAAAICLAHNHPSGDPSPSVEDIAVTKVVAAAGELLRIPLLDHVVVAGALWASLADAGHVPGRRAA